MLNGVDTLLRCCFTGSWMRNLQVYDAGHDVINNDLTQGGTGLESDEKNFLVTTL